MEVLKGKDIYSIIIDNQELMTKPKVQGVTPRPYWRGRYAGIGFIVTDAAFKEEWDKGNVAQISLKETSYVSDQADPMDPTKKLVRKSYVFSGYATRAQALGTSRFEAEENLIKIKVLKDMNLSDEDVRLLQAAF